MHLIGLSGKELSSLALFLKEKFSFKRRTWGEEAVFRLHGKEKIILNQNAPWKIMQSNITNMKILAFSMEKEELSNSLRGNSDDQVSQLQQESQPC